MPQPQLEVRALTKRFGGVVAIDEVTFGIHQGEAIGLIGPNGAGKTTLFNCMTGTLRPDGGAILFGTETRESLVGLAPHEVTECGIARTFQNVRLFTSMSVLENVLVGTHIRTRAGFWGAVLRTSEAHREDRWAHERAMGLLDLLSLVPYAEQVASALPFGLQRRLEIARALAADPSLLLLDEPAAGLNPVEKQQLVELIRRLKAQGLTILVIEHDMNVVMPISDRVLVLDYGKLIAQGEPSAIQNDERVIEAYLGTPKEPRDAAG